MCFSVYASGDEDDFSFLHLLAIMGDFVSVADEGLSVGELYLDQAVASL